MARSSFAAQLVLALVCIASLSSAATARSLRGVQPAAAVSSSSSVVAQPMGRRALAGRMEAPVGTAAGAALPADIVVAASACSPKQLPGARTQVTFTVAAPTAPALFKEVALQVDFPRPLWPGATLTCTDSKAQAIACAMPAFTPEQLKDEMLATACELGDMAATGPVTCTFAYTVPAAPLLASAAGGNGNQILGAVTFAPLADNVEENSYNNAAATCATA